jgi:ABC-type uncharacterized transport system substrate-binding protein
MKRREFITLIGGAAAAWPLAARAQQGARVRRIGVLMSYVESEAQQQARAFSQSLEALGWADGSNITLDYRWRGPPPGQLQAPAVALVQLNPDVLLAGATPAAIALKNATRSIPIVFANVADPVGQGFVASLGERQHERIWGLRIFDSGKMGPGTQRICSGGDGDRRDCQSGNCSLLRKVLAFH